MKLEQLAFSVTATDLEKLVQGLVSQMAARGGMPDGVSKPNATFEKGQLVLSTKVKMGFMPVTMSAAITLRPTTDGQGIVITLAKISAGIIGSEAIASQVMGEIKRMIGDLPGCSVLGREISVSKELLATKVAWLQVPGTVKTCEIVGKELTFAIG